MMRSGCTGSGGRPRGIDERMGWESMGSGGLGSVGTLGFSGGDQRGD